MKKVLRGNKYFLIILLLQLFVPMGIIFNILGVKDLKLALLITHSLLFLLPAIIYIIVTKQPTKEVLKLNKLHLKDLFFIILLAIVCQPVMTFFSLISQFFFTNEIGGLINNILETPYIILLLLIAVMPAITEEITIRGIILSEYEHVNTYLACAITGLLFGIMHLDPQQFLYTTILGFILALVVRITNSIYASALIHFIVNGSSITISKLMSKVEVSQAVTEQAEQINLMTISLGEKLILVMVYGCIAMAFGIIAYFIIKKLISLNVKRGTITSNSMKLISSESNYRKDYENRFDKILNIAVFSTIIIIYIFVMI